MHHDIDHARDHDADAPTSAQRLLAELVGTAALVLVGCGTAVVNRGAVLPTALAFGLTLAVLTYAFGRVSGAHLNPAVSIGAAAAGHLAWRDAGRYVGAQFAGGLAGAFVLMVLALGIDGYRPFDGDTPIGTNGFSAGTYNYAWWAAFLAELVLTALFVLVVLAVTDRRNRSFDALAPLAVGLALAGLYLLLGPLTGGSLNPARSFGPALLSGGSWLLQLWPFLLAPALAGLVAGLLHPVLLGRDADPVPGSGLALSSGRAGAAPSFAQQWNQGADAGAGAWSTQDATSTQRMPEQPIIENGWQWDPVAHQWIPAQQQPSAPSNWGEPDPGDERTQARPPHA